MGSRDLIKNGQGQTTTPSRLCSHIKREGLLSYKESAGEEVKQQTDENKELIEVNRSRIRFRGQRHSIGTRLLESKAAADIKSAAPGQ